MAKKSAAELSRIAIKAREKLLDNRLDRLSKKQTAELQACIRLYYSAKTELDYNLDIQTILYHELKPTTLESFCRNGDRNYLTAPIKRNWIKSDGIPLDVHAMYISEQYNRKITEQDCIDFMIDYPYGSETFEQAMCVQRLRDEIKSFVRFVATHKFIEKLYDKLNPVTIISHDPEVGF